MVAAPEPTLRPVTRVHLPVMDRIVPVRMRMNWRQWLRGDTAAFPYDEAMNLAEAGICVPFDTAADVDDSWALGTVPDAPSQLPPDVADVGGPPAGWEPPPSVLDIDEVARDLDPYQCDSCDRRFSTERGLDRHRTTQHGE